MKKNSLAELGLPDHLGYVFDDVILSKSNEEYDLSSVINVLFAANPSCGKEQLSLNVLASFSVYTLRKTIGSTIALQLVDDIVIARNKDMLAIIPIDKANKLYVKELLTFLYKSNSLDFSLISQRIVKNALVTFTKATLNNKRYSSLSVYKDNKVVDDLSPYGNDISGYLLEHIHYDISGDTCIIITNSIFNEFNDTK